MKNTLLKELVAFGSAGCDSWSWSMSCFFAVTSEMFYRGLNIPAKWQYTPLIDVYGDSRDKECYEFEFCKNATGTDLEHAGQILDRYTRLLKQAGLS